MLVRANHNISLETSYSKVLALRETGTEEREMDECLPEKIEVGEIYSFKKSDQRIFDLLRDIPLHKTEGNEILSSPLALVRILKVTSAIEDGHIWTRGKFKIITIINKDEILVWDKGRYIKK